MPYPEPEMLIAVAQRDASGKSHPLAVAEYLELRAQQSVCIDLAAFTAESVDFAIAGGDPEMLRAARVTAAGPALLKVPTQLGRWFGPEEDQVGAPWPVVISDRVWRRTFDADPRVIGQMVRLARTDVTIVGVAAPSFDMAWGEDCWLPRRFHPATDEPRTFRYVNVLGRLRPGYTLADARTHFAQRGLRMAAAHPEETRGLRLDVVSWQEFRVPQVPGAFQRLSWAAALVLLIAGAIAAKHDALQCTQRGARTLGRVARKQHWRHARRLRVVFRCGRRHLDPMDRHDAARPVPRSRADANRVWREFRVTGFTSFRLRVAAAAKVLTYTGMPRPSESAPPANPQAMRVLIALSVAHLLNDVLQALIPALYPLIKDSFRLSFAQIGIITFTYQLTASVLQPLVGGYTDRRPMPQSLACGMAFTLFGLVMFALATEFSTLVIAAGLTGTGSAIFHPEASRLARLASGGRHGFAQALFQVGGNFGSSLGPLFAALVIVPRGQAHLLWSALVALAAIALLVRLGRWYRRHLDAAVSRSPAGAAPCAVAPLPARRVALALSVLAALILSKYFYLAAMTSYYTFYLIERFAVSVQQAQVYLFVFLFAVAAGTIIGGPVGDRIGRRYVIWGSILGVAPFTLALPFTGLVGTVLLSIVIGVVLASAFSAILVYAQELMPGRVGFIAGLFFGLAFGMAGIGSALLGKLADVTSIEYVFRVSSFLPLIGLFAVLLPDVRGHAQPRRA